MATERNYVYTYGDSDEIALVSRNKMNIARWDGEGRIRLYTYNFEDTYKERVGRYIHKGLTQLWKAEQLFDLEVNISDQVFLCHRVILASISGYFRTVLTSHKSGGAIIAVQLSEKDVTPEVFQAILDMLYTGKEIVNQALALDLLKAAIYLDIPGLEYSSVDVLCKNLGERSCLKVWEWAVKHNSPDLAVRARGVALNHFSAIRHTEDFLRLPYEPFYYLMGHDLLKYEDEDELIHAILDWVDYYRKDRCRYLKELLPLVCFPYLSTKLLNELRKNDLIGQKSEFAGYLDEGLDFHLASLQPGGKKIQAEILARQTLTVKRLMPGMRRMQVMVGGSVVEGEPLTNVVACSLEMSYTSIYMFSIASLPHDVGLRFASCTWQNNIYVSGGSRTPDTFIVYRPNENTWYDLKGLPVGRVNHAMVAVDGKLYLLGGRTCQGPEKQKVLSEIHVYDTKVRSWDEVGRLAVPVESAPVVVVDSKVYIFGGLDNEGQALAVIQCLNTETGETIIAGELPDPVEGAKAALTGKDILLMCPEGYVLRIREIRTSSQDFTAKPHVGCSLHENEHASALEMEEMTSVGKKKKQMQSDKPPGHVTFAHSTSEELEEHGENSSMSELDLLGLTENGDHKKGDWSEAEPDSFQKEWSLVAMTTKLQMSKEEIPIPEEFDDELPESSTTKIPSTKSTTSNKQAGNTACKSISGKDLKEYREDDNEDEYENKDDDDEEEFCKENDAKEGEERQNSSPVDRALEDKIECSEENQPCEDENKEGEIFDEDEENADEDERVPESRLAKNYDGSEEDDEEVDAQGGSSTKLQEHDTAAHLCTKQTRPDLPSSPDVESNQSTASASVMPAADTITQMLTVRKVATFTKRRDFGIIVRKTDVYIVGGQAENGNFLDDLLLYHKGHICPVVPKLAIPLSGMQIEAANIHHGFLLQFFDASSCFYGE